MENIYFTLWRSGEELPEPYTFNTNLLDDIKNYLAWEIVDSLTAGNECLISQDNYANLNEIDWSEYDTTYEAVFNSINKVISFNSNDIINNYRTFDTFYFNNPENPSYKYYNIKFSEIFVLVISDIPFDKELCYGEFLVHNEFMIGQKPWVK